MIIKLWRHSLDSNLLKNGVFRNFLQRIALVHPITLHRTSRSMTYVTKLADPPTIVRSVSIRSSANSRAIIRGATVINT